MNARLISISLLATVMFSVTAQAQAPQSDYRPFAEDNKIWETQVGYILENNYENRVEGDTLINGENWKKVYNSVWGSGLHSYYVALRDVGKKVYAIAKGSNRPRLLYDFGMKEGDIVRCGIEGNAFGCLLDKSEQPDTLMGFPFVSYLRVERIDTVTACGLKHRRLTLTLLDAFREPFRNGEDVMFENVVWVEGVGSGVGPFSPWMPLPPENTLFLSCEIGKNSIFAHRDFYIPFESSGIYSYGVVSDSSYNGKLSDLQGRQLNTAPEKGIYIRDGKKFIRK